MNRELWKQSLSKTHCPAWPCPVCRKGIVWLVQKSLIFNETVQSKRKRDLNQDWCEMDTTYVFTAWGQCTLASCKQEFAIAGIGGLEPQHAPDTGYEWNEWFYPTSCLPMPDMFDITPNCPDTVRKELRAAFALFRSHRAACAGCIRVVLEFLMNHLGIKENKLHQRILSFAKNEPRIGQQLMAVKWLGNTAAHDANVDQDDLLDAFEIIEYVLVEIFDRRSARVDALAKKLAQKHERGSSIQ